MDYKILTARTTYDLEKYVRDHIARGWVPCGQVSHQHTPANFFGDWFERNHYTQAMTKTPKPL